MHSCTLGPITFIDFSILYGTSGPFYGESGGGGATKKKLGGVWERDVWGDPPKIRREVWGGQQPPRTRLSYLSLKSFGSSSKRAETGPKAFGIIVRRFVRTVPSTLGLVWPHVRPRSGSKSNIPGRILKSVRGPFISAEEAPFTSLLQNHLPRDSRRYSVIIRWVGSTDHRPTSVREIVVARDSTLGYAIMLPGRKSGFRAGFRPDSDRENLKIGPAGRRADVEAFPIQPGRPIRHGSTIA
jgi:hypothetical protein